ncbi:leukocyte elastase inhibitor-like [Oratosquilla oratoria]|uniref:leukocyte elastase inhibitor-like n=1 Tax=Oratosquilla oratoria TaxID=337810 RepID=UPI003F763887
MKDTPLALLPLVVLLIGSSSGSPSRTCPPDNFDKVNVTPEDISRTSSFGFDLFKKIKDQVPGQNLFFSSYSIWSALAIAYFGAEGKTLDQLQKVLRLGEKDKGYKIQRELSAELGKNTAVELDEANRAYFADSLILKECFRSGEFYDIHQVDFSDPVRLAREINAFVNSTTRGLIQKIVEPSSFEGSRFFLVNAVYFKGTWQDPFPEVLTRPGDFFCSPGVACGEVQMMGHSSFFNHTNSTHLGAEVLELPYLDSSISMLLFLPWEGSVTVDEVVDRLNHTTLKKVVSELWETRIFIDLPRFKMEQTLIRELQRALKELGITELFSRKADLSAFTNSNDLMMKGLIHKAVVDVNENGTEAAAATSLFPQSIPLVISFDRPFVFLILDKTFNLPIFSGIYRSPPV